MIYSFNITTPANTPIASPKKTDLPISKGVIHHWRILFPPGHWGECRMRVKKGADPILPINPDSFLLGDDFTFAGDDFLYVKTAPYILTAYTWNIDSVYEHTIYIHIFMKPLWTFSPFSAQLAEMVETEEILKVV